MNKLTQLREKFAHEITLYGITSVTVSGGIDLIEEMRKKTEFNEKRP